MVVVISNPAPVANEHTIINQLFDAGLQVFHLRKPHYTLQETKDLLIKINPEHHSKIALHYHHPLVKAFFLQRIHYTEEKRKRQSGMCFEKEYEDSKILSTSVHQLDEYQNLGAYFNYCFFGPVFDSISKPGYQAAIKQDSFTMPKDKATKIIAVGGIDENKIDVVSDFGFTGIALLGAVWQSENPVEQFRSIQSKWQRKEVAC